MRSCKHREGLDPTKSSPTPILNKSGVEVDLHDCDYVDARNALLVRAEREARAEVSAKLRTVDDREAATVAQSFSRTFITTMNRLAVDAGIAHEVRMPAPAERVDEVPDRFRRFA
jgi:hypothetical protein